MTIVISEFMDEDAVREGLKDFHVIYDPKLVDQPEALMRAVRDAEALIVRNRTQVGGALLDAAVELKVIGRLGVGLDNIDVEACKARAIAVYPATGANDVSVAEYVIACALMLLRGAYRATAEVAGGSWRRNKLVGRAMRGRRIGLIGFGATARQVARRALALGMEVSAYDPFVPADAWTTEFGAVTRAGIAEIIGDSDVISLHVPLNHETRGMIGSEAMSRMQSGAILINAARGGVVDETALVAALKDGRLGGAALDVFADEPLDAAHGGIFADVPNLILTPHIAGVTEESNIRVSWVTVENVRKHLAGS
jgi:(S)-sulfolactate dehydrogenase